MSIVKLRPDPLNGAANSFTTRSPWLVSRPSFDFPVYISPLSGYAFFESHIHHTFIPYFAGFDGMYCVKRVRPLYGKSCSSTVRHSVGLYVFAKFALSIVHMSDIGTALSSFKRLALVCALSNRINRKIFQNRRSPNDARYNRYEFVTNISVVWSVLELFAPDMINTPKNAWNSWLVKLFHFSCFLSGFSSLYSYVAYVKILWRSYGAQWCRLFQ